MTRKNANNRAARELQDALGVPLSRCFKLVARGIRRIETPPTTIDKLVSIVGARAADHLASDGYADKPHQCVVVGADAADMFGAHIVATRWMLSESLTELAAWTRLRQEAEVRLNRGDHAIFIGAMSIPELAEVLRQTTAPDSVAEVTALIARLSSPPVSGGVHVLAIAGGVSMSTSAPSVATCWCGHPVSMHDASGQCTWAGEVPVTDGMRALAAAVLPRPLGPVRPVVTVPYRCPCAGKAFLVPTIT